MAATGAALCRAQQPADDREIWLGPDLVAGSAQGERQYFFEPLQVDDTTDARNGVKKFDFAGGRFSASHRWKSRSTSPWRPARSLPCAWESTSAPRPRRRSSSTRGASRWRASTRAPSARRSPRSRPSARRWRTGSARQGVTLRFLGVGTTGAGRKFIGSIVKADLVVDEITAHARAAYALDPAIDTIIEIGGQDAKFTTMRDGMVTFSHMNTVCAAGTGSFLEEQAERLGCSLADYERRVRGRPRPAVQRQVRRVHGARHQQLSCAAAFPRKRSLRRRCTACGRTTCRRWPAERPSVNGSPSREPRRATRPSSPLSAMGWASPSSSRATATSPAHSARHCSSRRTAASIPGFSALRPCGTRFPFARRPASCAAITAGSGSPRWPGRRWRTGFSAEGTTASRSSWTRTRRDSTC